MTTTTGSAAGGHRITRFTTGLHQALDAVLDPVTGAVTWSMTPEDQRTTLVGLASAVSRLEALRLSVLAAADTGEVGIGADTGATSTAAWVAAATHQSRAAAHADIHLAHALDTTHTPTRDALAAGRVDVGQARVIIHAIDALPASITTQDRARAEAHLIGLAGEHDARALRILGRRVLEVLDPETADAEEGRHLEAEEQAAARATYLHLHDNHDGTHTGRFKLPDLHAAMLTTMLHAIASPTRHTDTGTGTGTDTSHTDTDTGTGTDPGTSGSTGTGTGTGTGSRTGGRVPRPELLGHAFCALLERMPADRLPTAAGMSATVVVLLDADQLTTRAGAAHLTTGTTISSTAARRLACEAGIVPLLYQPALTGPPVILDAGRKTRLHTETQRLALAARDRGCTAEHCDRPPGWTEAHHDTPWSQGGPTSLDNGRLLCRTHHQHAHSPNYHTEHLPNGQLRFHRRT